jgi:uncharacterized protein (TIGR02677 family)
MTKGGHVGDVPSSPLSESPHESDVHGGDRQERLNLYRYVTADNNDEYIAIMHLFSGTLLTDLSATEAAGQLSDHSVTLSVDEVEIRCRKLESWGNLVRSVRDARVATVGEWLRSRSRYQVSKLGGRVHRQVDDMLLASAGAREVARELLGSTVDVLDRILDKMRSSTRLDVDALAGDVTTVFNNQRLFTESARDFYAYLHQILSRYDLAGGEYAAFKKLLLDYVDLITADVARHAPVVADRLRRLGPHLDTVLDALATMPTLTGLDGSAPERSPGRSMADWAELESWYTGEHGRSGPAQLRAAAEQALGQLIANAKRMLAAAGTGVSRRADLLRLAAWFAEADQDDAHRIFAATFGAYPARHLLFGPEEQTARTGAATSWWDAEPVDVPVSLRERGDRAARGRTARVPDPGLDRIALLAEAEEEAERQAAAAAELIAVGELDGARMSPAARDLLLDRLGELLAVEQEISAAVTSTDNDLGLALCAVPDKTATTVLHSDDGTTTIYGLRLSVMPADPRYVGLKRTGS